MIDKTQWFYHVDTAEPYEYSEIEDILREHCYNGEYHVEMVGENIDEASFFTEEEISYSTRDFLDDLNIKIITEGEK